MLTLLLRSGLYADVDTLPLKSLTTLVVKFSPFAVCVGNAQMKRTDLVIPYDSMPRCKVCRIGRGSIFLYCLLRFDAPKVWLGTPTWS